MTYITRTGNYTSSIWLEYYPEVYSKQLKLSNQLEGSFSPTTEWEKVFRLGDEINRELKLSERDISDEITAYRKTKKKSSR